MVIGINSKYTTSSMWVKWSTTYFTGRYHSKNNFVLFIRQRYRNVQNGTETFNFFLLVWWLFTVGFHFPVYKNCERKILFWLNYAFYSTNVWNQLSPNYPIYHKLARPDTFVTKIMQLMVTFLIFWSGTWFGEEI